MGNCKIVGCISLSKKLKGYLIILELVRKLILPFLDRCWLQKGTKNGDYFRSAVFWEPKNKSPIPRVSGGVVGHLDAILFNYCWYFKCTIDITKRVGVGPPKFPLCKPLIVLMTFLLEEFAVEYQEKCFFMWLTPILSLDAQVAQFVKPWASALIAWVRSQLSVRGFLDASP